MSDLGPFWLSFRVASLATVLIVAVGLPMRPGPGAGPVSGQRAGGRHPGAAPGPAADGAGLLLAPDPRSAIARGTLARADSGRHACVPLVGGRRGSGRGGVSTVPVAGTGAFEAIDPALEDVARLLGGGELSVFARRHPPASMARAGRRDRAGFRPRTGDFGATLDGCRQHPGLTQTAALAIYDAVQVNDASRAGWLTLWISADLDPGASGRPAHLTVTRARAVSGSTARGPGRTRCSTKSIPRSSLDVSLRLGREIGVIFGPSGAGKTTLLRLIAGLARPHAGHVELEGDDPF